MKKLFFTFLGLSMAMNLAFAGGLVTNTNQSVGWVRMLARDASTSIDAVYFNPAGLTKLTDGFHLYLSNQSIFQKRNLSNSMFPGMEWEGKVNAPLFPNLYAAYKTGKLAFSLGFTPVGGGGSADFQKGIPMIEKLIFSLPSNFAALAANGDYTYDAKFTGSSVYYGIQGGVSYAINDMISIYVGARYVLAKNHYEGEITGIELGSNNPNMPLLTNTTLTAAATSYDTGGDNIQTAFDAGTPTATPVTTAEPSGGAITNGLLALGFNQTTINNMTLLQAQTAFYGARDNLTTGAGYLADKVLDADQTGTGITPIIGVNLALMDDKLNIGLKYEFQTNMDVTNDTKQDVVVGMVEGVPITMYPDGKKVDADIPALFTIGANYKFNDKFSAQLGFHYYFDKKVGWATQQKRILGNDTTVDVIDKNYYELAIGFEYALSDKLLLSCGYLYGKPGLNKYYYSDMSYSPTCHTVGLGGVYKLNDMISLELGAFNTWYMDITVEDPESANMFSQTYKKSNYGLAFGLNFNFGGGK